MFLSLQINWKRKRTHKTEIRLLYIHSAAGCWLLYNCSRSLWLSPVTILVKLIWFTVVYHSPYMRDGSCGAVYPLETCVSMFSINGIRPRSMLFTAIYPFHWPSLIGFMCANYMVIEYVCALDRVLILPSHINEIGYQMLWDLFSTAKCIHPYYIHDTSREWCVLAFGRIFIEQLFISVVGPCWLDIGFGKYRMAWSRCVKVTCAHIR